MDFIKHPSGGSFSPHPGGSFSHKYQCCICISPYKFNIKIFNLREILISKQGVAFLSALVDVLASPGTRHISSYSLVRNTRGCFDSEAPANFQTQHLKNGNKSVINAHSTSDLSSRECLRLERNSSTGWSRAFY